MRLLCRTDCLKIATGILIAENGELRNQKILMLRVDSHKWTRVWQDVSWYHACTVALVYTRHKIYRLRSGNISFLFLCQYGSGAENKPDLSWMSFDYFIYQPFSRSTRENHCSHYSCISLCERRKTFKLKKNNIIFFCNLVHTELLWGLGVHNFNSFSFLCSFWVSVHFYKFYPFLQYLFSSTGAT